MSVVVKLPRAATSYYTVRKAGKRWDVVLVTPHYPRPITTALYGHADRESAVAHGQAVAAKMLRPFKARAAR